MKMENLNQVKFDDIISSLVKTKTNKFIGLDDKVDDIIASDADIAEDKTLGKDLEKLKDSSDTDDYFDGGGM